MNIYLLTCMHSYHLRVSPASEIYKLAHCISQKINSELQRLSFPSVFCLIHFSQTSRDAFRVTRFVIDIAFFLPSCTFTTHIDIMEAMWIHKTGSCVLWKCAAASVRFRVSREGLGSESPRDFDMDQTSWKSTWLVWALLCTGRHRTPLRGYSSRLSGSSKSNCSRIGHLHTSRIHSSLLPALPCEAVPTFTKYSKFVCTPAGAGASTCGVRLCKDFLKMEIKQWAVKEKVENKTVCNKTSIYHLCPSAFEI